MTDPFERLRALSEPGAMLDPVLMAHILEILPDGVLVIDEGGIVRLMNRQAELIFGWPRTDVLGREMELLIPTALRERHAAHRRSYFRNPHARPMGLGLDLKGLRRNGDEIALEINLNAIVHATGIYAVAVIRTVRHDALAQG